MRRIQTYVDLATAEALTKFATEKNMSHSTAAGDILKLHFENAAVNEKNIIDAKTKAYFLRILNTLNQVLMCVYDKNKVGVKAESAQVCIQKITDQIQTYVERKSINN